MTHDKIDVKNTTQENSLRAVCYYLDSNGNRQQEILKLGKGKNLKELIRSVYNQKVIKDLSEEFTEIVIQRFSGEKWEEVDLDL